MNLKIESEEKIKSDIEICLEGKSPRARKAWLTKEIGVVRNHLYDLEQAIKCPPRSRYLHGDFITPFHVANTKRELKVLLEMRLSTQ